MERVFLNLCGRSWEYPDFMQPREDENLSSDQKTCKLAILFFLTFATLSLMFGLGCISSGTPFQMGFAAGACAAVAAVAFGVGVRHIIEDYGIVTKREVDQLQEKSS